MPNRLSGTGKKAKSQFVSREIKHLKSVKHYPQKRAEAAALHMYRSEVAKRRRRHR